MANTDEDGDEEVVVRIPRHEYDRLQKRVAQRAQRSGRMSLRIPHPLVKLLDAQSRKTGRAKSKIVIDALRVALAPPTGVLE